MLIKRVISTVFYRLFAHFYILWGRMGTRFDVSVLVALTLTHNHKPGTNWWLRYEKCLR
jgi:hypothetical protein